MDSTSADDIVEEREELMVCKNPCFNSIDGSEAMNLSKNRSPLDLKALPLSVSFHGWRFSNRNFKSWARKMAALHETTWKKAGIFEAIMASSFRIYRNTDLVLGITDKWCPDTKTFIFSWGETTITLEDVMVLLGFSVLGLPVFATLGSSEKNIQRNLKKEWLNIKDDKRNSVTLRAWMKRFVDCGGELEHVAFLALWLNYFVFPSRNYHISEAIFPIALHLSSGTRIALAPAVLVHLYSELTLLKSHITDFTKSPVKIELGSLFQLVQLWTWERFKELQPKPNPILNVEPRLARWYDITQETTDVRQILENSNFVWRPYTKTVENWKFPLFYPEKAMRIPVVSNLDDEFISFARFIKVSALVGIDCVEHYFPNRVALQFGLLQDVPAPVNRNRLSQEEAWNDYNKPSSDLKLYIPSRSEIPCVTPTFSKWRKKSFAKSQYSSEDASFVPSSSKMNKRSKYMKRSCQKQVPSNNDDSHIGARMMMSLKKKRKDVNNCGGDASEPIVKRSRKEAIFEKPALVNKMRFHLKHHRDKRRRKYRKQARDKRHNMKQVPSDNNDKDDNSLTNAQMRLDVKKSGGDASETLGKTSRLEMLLKKPASLGANGDVTETVSPPEIEETNQETNETGSNTGGNTFQSSFDESNASDAPLDSNGELAEIGVSPSETRQICDDVYGSNADMVDGDSAEPECFLFLGDGAVADETARSNETLCIEAEKEDNVVDGIEEPALKADSSESSPCQKLASGGNNGCETSKAHESFDLSTSDGCQGQVFLLHKRMRAHVEELDKKYDEYSEKFEKSYEEGKLMATSLAERIKKSQEDIAWLQERRAAKQRKIASAPLI